MHNHEMQIMLFQQQMAHSLNTQRILEPISRMLTSIRNILVKMPSHMKVETEEERRKTDVEAQMKSKIQQEVSVRRSRRDTASRGARGKDNGSLLQQKQVATSKDGASAERGEPDKDKEREEEKSEDSEVAGGGEFRENPLKPHFGNVLSQWRDPK